MNERVRKVLKIKGLTDEYVSQKVGVSIDTIYRIRTGLEPPSIGFMEFLAQKHPNLNLNWLVLGKGEVWIKTESKTVEQIKIGLIEKRYVKLEKMYNQLAKNYEALNKTANTNKDRTLKNGKNIRSLQNQMNPYDLIEAIEKYKFDRPNLMAGIMKGIEEDKKEKEEKEKKRKRNRSPYIFPDSGFI